MRNEERIDTFPFSSCDVPKYSLKISKYGRQLLICHSVAKNCFITLTLKKIKMMK